LSQSLPQLLTVLLAAAQPDRHTQLQLFKGIPSADDQLKIPDIEGEKAGCDQCPQNPDTDSESRPGMVDGLGIADEQEAHDD
jgi:hypothetical protein